MAITAPSPVSFNPVGRMRADVREARALRGRLPPGDLDVSARRTRRSLTDPLGMLLEAYERHGPVFTLRILYQPIVFALGPEANRTVLVTDADAFSWREGAFRDLIPLLGDGLLTIDGPYHRQARRIMLPAFHRERLRTAVDAVVDETDRALAPWRAGDEVDLERWTRELALRIALRALLGLDPDGRARDLDLAAEWERALAFYGRDYLLQSARGPRTPFARMRHGRQVIGDLLEAEVRHRRAGGAPSAGPGEDLLSLLVEARTEDGEALSVPEARDQAITLLFAGHDTTTATVGFLFWELARHPQVLAKLRAELDEATGGEAPTYEQVAGGLPYLDQVLDETLRLYPPAWIGPRRVMRDVEVAGVPMPGRRAHRLLLLRQPPPGRRVGAPARLRSRALLPRARGGDPQGRLRARSAAARGRASGCASASSRSS